MRLCLRPSSSTRPQPTPIGKYFRLFRSRGQALTVICLQDRINFPTGGLTRRPSADTRRDGPPPRPRVNRALSLAADPLTSSTLPQKSQKPRITRKASDPPAGVPIPQPRRPPSRTGAPEHPGSSSLPQHNPHGRGRRVSGPPAVTPRPQQRRATSRSSAHEQDTIRQSPPRPRPHCRDWLRSGCPRGPTCLFTHDPEVCFSLHCAIQSWVDIHVSRREQRKNFA